MAAPTLCRVRNPATRRVHEHATPAPEGPYCHGAQPTLADCALIPQLYNATRWGVAYDHLPRISAVASACAGHPAFQAAHPRNFDPSREARETEEERP